MLGHTLLAGITGSGKSYAEHMMIETLIEQKAILCLVDPKRVELGQYKDRAFKYASDASDIESVVRSAFTEMESRLKRMEEEGKNVYDGRPVYLIIDEMLPITSNKEMVKNGTVHFIEQIAFLGRAAKVFLIVCTQCPTRQFLPPLIKVNLPDIICLRQKDRRDYRYVLDQNVEPLKGKYGECYLVKDGMPPIKMATDDAVKSIMEEV
jgi:DNA segregation ATPase FtsK/SpoIIIE-like protein